MVFQARIFDGEKYLPRANKLSSLDDTVCQRSEMCRYTFIGGGGGGGIDHLTNYSHLKTKFTENSMNNAMLNLM